MDGADKIFQLLSPNTSVIKSTEQEARNKLNALGGIPTKVIRSCKPSPTGSSMNMSTCSSLYSSDSEEEVVSKKRCLTSIMSEESQVQITVADVDAQTPPQVQPVRVVPLRPVCSIFLITHNQDNYSTDVYAPDFPQAINEAHPGIEVDLDKIKLPCVRTIAEAYDENQRRMRFKYRVLGEKYRIVWHSVPLDGYGDFNEKYTVPFTVDKSNILLRGTPTTVPMDTATKTLEYALQRAQTLSDLQRTLIENAPIRRIRSSMYRSQRHRNDNRIVSLRKYRRGSSELPPL